MRRLPVPALLISAAFAGCGGSDEGSSAGGATGCASPARTPAGLQGIVPARATVVSASEEPVTRAQMTYPGTVAEALAAFKACAAEADTPVLGGENEGFEAELFLGSDLAKTEIRIRTAQDAAHTTEVSAVVGH